MLKSVGKSKTIFVFLISSKPKISWYSLLAFIEFKILKLKTTFLFIRCSVVYIALTLNDSLIDTHLLLTGLQALQFIIFDS